jgi:Xaa-Pro aminopeptidase
MDETGCEAALVLSPENRRYFSGFTAQDMGVNESAGAILVTASRLWLLTDSRFTTQAAGEAPLYEVVEYKGGLPHGLKSLGRFAGTVCMEAEHVTVDLWSKAAREAEAVGMGLKPMPFKPGELRVVKSPGELELVRKAVRVTEKALGLLWKEMRPGITESWAAFFLETKFRELGAEGPAFPSIVATGPNAALPHAVPGRKRISKNECAVIDIGARFRGYCSDMTRTHMPEMPAPWQKDIYKAVREAQLLALEVLRAGAICSEVDAAARGHIAARGFGEYFGHSLGHGVGLQVHEAPTLGPNSHKPLPCGALVTVEPGIYIPGKGGVRLEELCLVTEKGCEILNRDKHFYVYNF